METGSAIRILPCEAAAVAEAPKGNGDPLGIVTWLSSQSSWERC